MLSTLQSDSSVHSAASGSGPLECVSRPTSCTPSPRCLHERALILESTDTLITPRAEARRWLLLVEDDEPLARVLAEALRADGWTVAVITDGLKAFEAVREAHPDVVVLDLNLPRLYGQVLLHALKRDPATSAIPIIVATGHPELLTNRDRPLAAAVLHKPFSLDSLLAAAEAARRAA